MRPYLRTLVVPLALPIFGLFSVPVIKHALSPAGGPCVQQGNPPPSHQAAFQMDSGLVRNTSGQAGEVVFSETVRIKGALWLRLQFTDVQLAGDPAADNASYLRLTSVKDGAVQLLNAEGVDQWGNTSAYFNGDAVIVEIISYAGAGDSRVAIEEVTAGDPHITIIPVSICGSTDDRQLSSDPRGGRHLPEGCSAWLHDDLNRTFMAAGHCGVGTNDVIQFNVPLSNTNGSVNHPPPSDQYTVEPTSVQGVNGGVGNDFVYFGTNPNSTTGLSAFQVQGQSYIKATSAPAVSGQTIRVIGYGTTSSPVSPTWNQVQKTHQGPYVSQPGTTIRYAVDTTGGNSGSAVENLANNTVIGVHTHAGCTSSGGSNQGTAIHLPALQNALNNPKGICLSGRANVSPPLYVSGDLNNNFGTANTASGLFGKISEIPTSMQGLAYNKNNGVLYGTSGNGRLYSINPATGVAAQIGVISGTAQVINGLGYDPNTNTLYGIAQSTGQLFTIHTGTAAAVSVGGAWGNTVGALDYDPNTNTLYGIDDFGGASRLIRIDKTTGAQTVVGALGAGITDCNGLAYNDRDNQLYTINAGNERVLRINPATGVATLVGASSGLFGSGYGMAVTLASTLNAPPNFVQVILGSLMSGGNSQLINSDNQWLVVLQTPFRPRSLPAVQVEVRSTAPGGTPAQLKFRLEAMSDAIPVSSVTQRIELFNYVTSTWEQVDSRPATGTESVVEVTISSNPSRFINAGSREMKARLNWFDPGTLSTRNWTVSIDQTLWILEF